MSDEEKNEEVQNPVELPDLDDRARGNADIDERNQPPGNPTLASIERALRANEAQEPSMSFRPAYATPGDAPFAMYPGNPNANEGGFSFAPQEPGEARRREVPQEARDLRTKIDDLLPAFSVLIHLHNLYADDRRRGEVDRLLDVLGYEPVEYNYDRTRMRIPEEREAVYRALSGAGLS